MTEKKEKYGCLTKSLEKFLEMNKDEREEKYKYGKAKIYERIVKNVQESFRDAVFVYKRLPPEYSRKIDLNMGYNMVQVEIIRQKSPKDRAHFAISQARQALNMLTIELGYPDYITKLFNDDFCKVQNWLPFLDNLEPTLKNN